MRRAVTAAMLLAATLAVSACAVPSPSPTTDPATSPIMPTEAPADVPVEATIVVAGPDLDGTTVSASGYVRGLVESGGWCTFEFSDETGGTTSAESTGEADSSTTSCGLVSVPRESLVKGTWSVVLTYSSSSTDSVFRSAPATMEVP